MKRPDKRNEDDGRSPVPGEQGKPLLLMLNELRALRRGVERLIQGEELDAEETPLEGGLSDKQ